jgi:GNAT superfamily N-acetyltransferase
MDGNSPTLRVATPADAPALQALMQASAAAIFPAFYDAAQTASAVRHVAVPDPALLEDGTYYVLEAGGEAVACGGWSRRGRPYMGSPDAPGDDRYLDPATEAAHVRAMFVRADWTRNGLGRRIIERCEEDAGRLGFRRLDLVATLPGILLYRACGFEPTAEPEDVTLVDGVRLTCLAMSKPIGVVAST